jgi:PAS domain S-box-containing protein
MATGWTTVIAVSEASINRPLTRSLALWVGGAILFLSLGIGLALLVARRITTPITALTQSVDLVRRGQRFVMPQAAVQEVQELNTVLAVTADAIRQRAEERQHRLTAEAEAAERQRAADAIGQLNQELRHVQDELAAELEGMQCLHTLSTTLVQHRDFHRLLEVILDAAIRLSRANKGHVQLLDATTGALFIVAQRGFAGPFVEFFNQVHGVVGSCSTAMQYGERVIVEDVTQSTAFMDTPALDVMLAADVRAVQSTPLISRTGRLLGLFSTHYPEPYRPGDREQRLLDLLAWLAADAIERAQAEEALRESEARFRTMANATPVLIWMSGLDTLHTYFNKGWLDFTGRPLEQELGQGWTAGVHPQDREQCLATYTAAFAQRQPFEMQYRLRRHDGHYRWVLDRGVPLLHPNGTFGGYIGGCIDISDRLEAEQALQQAHAALEQRVQERTAELAAALQALQHEMAERTRMEAERQRLEEASRRVEHFALLGRLAAGVSHEIRNPLGVIYLHADILEEELAQLPWEYQDLLRPTLDEIKTHLVRIDNLVQDYLSLVRVTTIQRQPQDLGTFVEVVAKELQADLVAHGITLTLEGLGQLGMVALHANTFRRALLNLVHNAMDAMPEGGLLTFCGHRNVAHVVLDLHDTGTGMPAEQLVRIFEPLYTTKPGGTGLGLYLVREIITAHDGEITVQSTVGHGTTFTITLPRAAMP